MTTNLPRVAFIDLDGVVFHPGTNDFIDGAPERLKQFQADGWEICFFTCRPMGRIAEPWINALKDAGVDNTRCGYIHKPLADSYCYVDDKLDLEASDVRL